MGGRVYEGVVRHGWRTLMELKERRIERSRPLGTPVTEAQRRSNELRGVPVVLVPGYGNTSKSMQAFGRSLQRDGFKVCYATLPDGNMGDADVAADSLERQVAAIRKDTGAKQVLLLGHSRGGLIARALAQRDESPVEKVVTLNSANQGLHLGKLNKAVRPLLPEGMIEISRGSDLIGLLEKTDSRLERDQFVAVGTDGFDGILAPASAARDPEHDFISVDQGRRFGPFSRVTHYGVLTDDRAYEAVRSALMAAPVKTRVR